MSHRLVIAAVGALALSAAAGAARAQITVSVSGGNPTIASYYQIGHCLDVGNNNVIMYATCDSNRGAQGWRFVSGSYGMISLGNQTCLQANAAGAALTAAVCTNADNQKWSYTAGTGELRNQQASLCADVEGGNRASGGRIVAYRCQGSMNQKWYLATSGGSATYQISASTPLTVRPASALVSSRSVASTNIVAGGAGNISVSGGRIVAGGAGNIVAGGAGNIIAASIVAGGAGNIVAGGAGNIVAGGAGNLIANDGVSLTNIQARSY